MYKEPQLLSSTTLWIRNRGVHAAQDSDCVVDIEDIHEKMQAEGELLEIILEAEENGCNTLHLYC